MKQWLAASTTVMLSGARHTPLSEETKPRDNVVLLLKKGRAQWESDNRLAPPLWTNEGSQLEHVEGFKENK